MPPSKPPDDIRDRIRNERIRLHLTVADAAQKLGVSRQSYLQLETKTVDPRVSMLVRLVSIGMRLSAIVPELAKPPAARRAGR